MLDRSGTMHRYFAIASMMNPISLKYRNIHPTSSRPAQILDFKLGFFGTMGFAEAIPHKGETFHGVVHELTDEEMKHLDDIETTLYVKTDATVRYYDGTEDTAFVYCKASKDSNDLQVGVPQDRYIDLMIEGAAHYGVDPDYIESLRKVESVPRPHPSEFRSFGPPPSDGVTMTIDEVLKCDGEAGRPLYATVNGKVLHIVSSKRERFHLLLTMRKKMFSPAIEELYPKIAYDPLYGVPENLNDCTREHCGYLEHLFLTRIGKESAVVVGTIQQRYKD